MHVLRVVGHLDNQLARETRDECGETSAWLGDVEAPGGREPPLSKRRKPCTWLTSATSSRDQPTLRRAGGEGGIY